EQQAEQTDDDGSGAGRDRLKTGPPSYLDRGPGGFEPGQLLAVAGHQKQPIVGGGADDQNEQDALALPVERNNLVLGEQVNHSTGQREAADRGEQHHERQRNRPVDQQQDD